MQFLGNLLAVLGVPIIIFGGLGFLCWYSSPRRPWMQRMYRMRMYHRAIELFGKQDADQNYPDCAAGKPLTDDEFWASRKKI